MQRAAALTLMVALSTAAVGNAGCVTGVAIWKRDSEVSVPLLVGAVAADLVVTGLVASQVQDFTPGASIGTALAVTAVDFGVGCLIGACRALRL
jgi:hypothetical protein